jgi:hypothetical protein
VTRDFSVPFGTEVKQTVRRVRWLRLPRTDGQQNVRNRTLEEAMQGSYAAVETADWDSHLPPVEFRS